MAARDVTVAQGLAYPVPARKPRAQVSNRARVERIERSTAATVLVVLMAVGSIALWTGVPIGALWLASQVSHSQTQLTAAPLLIVALGIPTALALGAKGLALLEGLRLRLTGATAPSRRVPAWRRSLSDSRSAPPASVLDKIMVASVLAAAVSLAGWFFLFAGSPLG
jgi:hypothetical protein